MVSVHLLKPKGVTTIDITTVSKPIKMQHSASNDIVLGCRDFMVVLGVLFYCSAECHYGEYRGTNNSNGYNCHDVIRLEYINSTVHILHWH